MADAPADGTTGQPASQTRAGWFAIIFAVLAWCLGPVAAFVGIGEPPPGPDYQRALAYKTALAHGIYGAALLAGAGAVVSGLIARARGGRAGLFGVLVGGTFLAATVAWWLVVR
ncbi:MAG TPA: hypothetical protein VHO06_14305 [Polyangia bacterium]|nr:hypothetical protein [Polyangia bacterium]